MSTSDAPIDSAAHQLLPARMLNEYAYCPRLCWLEWVAAEWSDSADTIEGRYRHKRVDQPGGELPGSDAVEEGQRIHARSVHLEAAVEGLTARIDLVEGDGRSVTPVDYKRGAKPDVPGGLYEPERVQVCAQAMILRENGYAVHEGVVYFAASHERVSFGIDEPLVARTRQLALEMRAMATGNSMPPPLADSPKCVRCSLNGICLPDETRWLNQQEKEPRRLYPARDDALPVYVQTQGATVGKKDECLVVKEKEHPLREVRLIEVSQVSLFGAVQITTQAMQALFEHEIPLSFFSRGGWFYGIAQGLGCRNAFTRTAQFAAARDSGRCLTLARRIVSAKIRNCRTMLRRNHADRPEADIDRLRDLATSALAAETLDSLLGIEGSAARIYFAHFAGMLKQDGHGGGFDLDGRNRRPPRDPVNALLSYAYALLAKDFTVTLLTVGLDPYVGYYHQPRHGRPALALDLMEEFRPLIADSVVINTINMGVVQQADFVRRGGAVALNSEGRSRFLLAYERRMDELVTHPVFGYRVNYRRILEVQARLLARYLMGEIPEYPEFVTR